MANHDSTGLADSASPVRARRTRWRLRFGLRTFVILALLVGASIGMVARRIIQAEHQSEIVDSLAREFFVLTYDDGTEVGGLNFIGGFADEPYFWRDFDFWHRVVKIQTPQTMRCSQESLERVAELPDLERLDINLPLMSDPIHVPPPSSRRRLKQLSIGPPYLSAEDATWIAECDSLTALQIELDGTPSPELALFDRLKRLEGLYIGGRVADDVVRTWQHIRRLDTLVVHDASALSEETLAAFLRQNPALRKIRLGTVRGDVARVCEALRDCRSLTHLWLEESALDDEGLSKLRDLPCLEKLVVKSSRVRGSAFSGTSFSKVADLSVTDSPIDDQGVALLAKLPKLRSLDLSKTEITDAACEYLGSCNLVKLDLSKNRITDAGIGALNSKPLVELNVYGTEVSTRSFTSVSQWPSLSVLSVGKRAETEAELEELLQNPNLKTLNADGPTSDAFLQRYYGRFTLTPFDDQEQLQPLYRSREQ